MATLDGNRPRRPGAIAPIARAALIAGLAVLAVGGDARAQFGFGFGYGFMRPYTPPSVNFLYQRSNVRAGAMGGRPSNNSASNQAPDRFAYRRQQVAMQQRADVESTRPLTESVDPGPGRGAAPADADARGQRIDLPVTSFVNESDQVVWPADAPASGELGRRQEAVDAAVRDVAVEYRATGSAQVETVANARKSLLDYGRPALEQIRATSTPRIADTFHIFLLTLYDSLAQAAGRRGPPLR